MFRTYIIKHNQVLITSAPVQTFEYQVGLPTNAILSFIFSDTETISQWDNAIRTLLKIPKTARYIIVDVGEEVSPGLYKVAALLPDSEISRYIQVVSSQGSRTNFDNT